MIDILQEFEMSNLGNLAYFLGMKFMKTDKGIFLHRKKYVEDKLKIFHMRNHNVAITSTEPQSKLSKYVDEEFVDATM